MTPTPKRKSPLANILLAFIPYSHQNLMLAYKPNKFFNELERVSGHKKTALKSAYERGRKRGLIKGSGSKATLTKYGLREIQPYITEKLKGDALLLVVFDVPEQHSSARTRLRRLLKSWNFEQVQKSVWSTDYNYEKALVEVIAELGLEEHARLYESNCVFPSNR